MIRTIINRIGVFFVTVVASSIIVFLLLSALPGDAAATALGTDASPAALEAKRHELGLDRPLIERYVIWAADMVHGDMGKSSISGADIASEVISGLEVTLLLVVVAMVIALLIAFVFGILAAVYQSRPLGLIISVLSQIGVAIPSFLAALILVIVFAVNLSMLPATGWASPSDLPAFIAHITLPALSLGLVQGAIMSRYVRSAVLEVTTEDFMRTARAKGLGAGAALRRHGLRNALVPIMNVAGIEIASLLIGAVVVERVFEIRGLGSLLISSVQNRDLPQVQAIVMILVLLVLLVNLIVDILSSIVDPRIGGAR